MRAEHFKLIQDYLAIIECASRLEKHFQWRVDAAQADNADDADAYRKYVQRELSRMSGIAGTLYEYVPQLLSIVDKEIDESLSTYSAAPEDDALGAAQ